MDKESAFYSNAIAMLRLTKKTENHLAWFDVVLSLNTAPTQLYNQGQIKTPSRDDFYIFILEDQPPKKEVQMILRDTLSPLFSRVSSS